jgi:hypothetical protein
LHNGGDIDDDILIFILQWMQMILTGG